MLPLRVHIAAIHIGKEFVITNAAGDPAGHATSSHHRVKRVVIMESGADRGGNHIKQPANDGVPAARPVSEAA